MELDDIPFERDGEYLCTISAIESLPLVPHKSSPLVTSILGSDIASLCFRKSKNTLIYFTPCVKVREKVYRRAKDTDTDMYLCLAKKKILLPSNPTTYQLEYFKNIRSSFLSYDLGYFYLSSVPSDNIYNFSKEIYQKMKTY